MPTPENIARQDANGRDTVLWVSSADGKTPVAIQVNPATGAIMAELP